MSIMCIIGEEFFGFFRKGVGMLQIALGFSLLAVVIALLLLSWYMRKFRRMFYSPELILRTVEVKSLTGVLKSSALNIESGLTRVGVNGFVGPVGQTDFVLFICPLYERQDCREYATRVMRYNRLEPAHLNEVLSYAEACGEELPRGAIVFCLGRGINEARRFQNYVIASHGVSGRLSVFAYDGCVNNIAQHAPIFCPAVRAAHKNNGGGQHHPHRVPVSV